MHNILYNRAIKIISKRLYKGQNKLTQKYLIEKGWITEYDSTLEKTFFIEPNIKQRDKVSVEFESHYYRVWHGPNRTFIALESCTEWFEMYMMLIGRDNYGILQK